LFFQLEVDDITVWVIVDSWAPTEP
jgi:hypothetical protein